MLAEAVGKWPGFTLEGGVCSLARRDGLATVMYTALEEMGELPEHYFQAVGSAAGAIASHEAAKRVREATASRRTALPRLSSLTELWLGPIQEGEIPRDFAVLLNLTRGGRARLSQDGVLQQAEPICVCGQHHRRALLARAPAHPHSRRQ
ncbi:hypothetical protein ACFYO0_05935 [Streptomyces sp. NPDC006365]|uniref:hypothetical protein n=1 Tax=Streptomyces sp. NPDC006365 TaxID=3364744 RepID=UPI0036CC3214